MLPNRLKDTQRAYFPCSSLLPLWISWSGWFRGCAHWIIVLCDAQDQTPSRWWALCVLCQHLYVCGSNIYARCLPFFSLVVPLDDKLHVWRPPTAAELQSSTTQEEHCSSDLNTYLSIAAQSVSNTERPLEIMKTKRGWNACLWHEENNILLQRQWTWDSLWLLALSYFISFLFHWQTDDRRFTQAGTWHRCGLASHHVCKCLMLSRYEGCCTTELSFTALISGWKIKTTSYLNNQTAVTEDQGTFHNPWMLMAELFEFISRN